ncbi:MAG: DEAD/DEAH box helicase, partial [Candidatus Methanofastidiosia archaeon]
MKHLHPKIISLLEEKGFSSLTLSQKLGIPKILSGEDTLIIARTGSGKTEAAVLPIFSNLLEYGGEGIKVLYIAPLKALNRDLLDRLEWWAERLEIKIAVRHGDTSKSERRKQTLNPPDVLITTPETLQALLIGKRMRVNLIPLRFVVIDEIHELCEEKRGIQLSLGLERLVELCGRKFQRIGLSATVGTPKEVARFLSEKAMVVDATEEKGLEVLVEYPLGKNPELSDFLQVNTETASRIERILKLISEHESVLIFVNTREMAETLSSRFNLITHEIDVHHSSLSKYMRIDTEKRFKAQKLKSIVCTSSMELGIDIGSVDLVIQYASPRKVSRLVQRAGRSGHRIGETSRAFIIAVSEDDILEASVIARKAVGNELEETRIYENALDVLADQLVGLLMDEYRFEIERAFRVVKRAYPYRNLSKEKFLEVLDFLKALRLIWREEGYFGRKRSAMNYYFENLSMIPDTKHYKIFEVGTNSYIGTLDEEFIATRAEIGENFVVKGRAWTLLDIKEDRVEVSESKVIGAIPAWEGELIPVPFEVAQEVAKMRENFSKSYPISKEAFSALKKYLEEHEKNDPIPSSYEILIEEFKDFVVIHAPFGSLANETLGRLISVLLSSKLGA